MDSSRKTAIIVGVLFIIATVAPIVSVIPLGVVPLGFLGSEGDPDYPQLKGLEGLQQLFDMDFKAFPDWHETIEDIIAEGDKVWVRLFYTGTHTGQFIGLALTGKKITSKAVDIYRIVNGKLAEYWNVTDNLTIQKQIGAIEYTEKGKKLFPEDETQT